jgi:hypothetical protein
MNSVTHTTSAPGVVTALDEYLAVLSWKAIIGRKTNVWPADERDFRSIRIALVDYTAAKIGVAGGLRTRQSRSPAA